MSEHSPKKLPGPGAVFRAYIKYLRKEPLAVFGAYASVTVIQIVMLFIPIFLKDLFNTVASATPSEAVLNHLLYVIGAIAILWLVQLVAMRTEHFINIFMESKLMSTILSDSFGYLIGHSHNFFVSHFAGSLTHKINKFTRSFELIYDSVTLQFYPTLLFSLGAVYVLSQRNVWLGVGLAVWILCFIFFQVYVSGLRQPSRTARADADSKITASLADSISNQNTTLLFAGVTHEQNIIKGVAEIWRKATVRSWLADAYIWTAFGFFMMIAQIGLLYGAVLLWRQGLVTVGDFILIQAYLFTLFERLIAINRELRKFYDSITDAAEMVAILETSHEIKDLPGAKDLRVERGALEFKGVDFYFNETRVVLKDLTLIINPGEKVALVGPSGAGKSTITKLLLRLYDLARGTIEIDGQNIARVTQESLRNAISFVPQEPILFHRTLMENIRYGRRDATDAEVLEAAKQAHCHEFIAALPLQYETFVGERGVKLSGGERQRVAIARAILKNAPILVLDEATSSLDSESEMLIQDALTTLMQGKTVIVIAHRLSTIMKMDRILVLDGGTVVADGTHQKLLEQGGLYQKLWNIQAGGFIPEEEEPNMA